MSLHYNANMKDLNYEGVALAEDEAFKALPEALQKILRQHNGFVALAGGFHLRGHCSKPLWHSLQAVTTGDWALADLFDDVTKGDIPFAQDCMGDQFILRENSVWRLYCEAGELEALNMSLETFMDGIEKDAESLLDLEVMDLVNDSEEALELGDVMIADPPFCMEESEKGVKLTALPCLEAIEYYAELAANIKSLAKETIEDS